jgi:hypothetical protein
MRILKSVLAGIVLGFFAAVLGTFIEIAAMFWKLTEELNETSGGIGAVGGEMHFPLYALVGFAAGAFGYFRWGGRTRRAAIATPPSL